MNEINSKTPASFKAAILTLIIICTVYAVATYVRNSVWADEFTLWEDVTGKSPMKSRGHTYLGLAHARAKNLKSAYLSLSTAVSLNPTDVEARYNMGVYLREVKKFPQAKAEFEYVIRERPDLIEPYLALAGIYADLGGDAKALELLSGARARWPDDTRVMLQAATAYGKSGKLREAEADFKRVLEIDGANGSAMTGLGNTYYLQGNLKKALEFYRLSADNNPSDPEPLYNIALIFERLGNYDEATSNYERFIKVASNYEDEYSGSIVEAKRRLGIIKYRRGL